MESRTSMIAVFCIAVLLVGAINTIYQIYHITLIDAKARGLKHPKLWGLLAMNNNNSSGLLLYLIKRRKHPILTLSAKDKSEIEKKKKAACIGLIFLCIGAIGLVVCISFL